MTYILAALVIGSLVYCVLVIVAARNYLAAVPIYPPQTFPPISILKPLHGLDDGLEENLISFFEQDYPHFEILLAFRTADDLAYGLVKEISQRYPKVPSRILLGGEPPWPNAKVWSSPKTIKMPRAKITLKGS